MAKSLILSGVTAKVLLSLQPIVVAAERGTGLDAAPAKKRVVAFDR